MVDIGIITTAIGAATAAVELIDKMADQIDRFITKKPEPEVPEEHRRKFEKEGDTIVSKFHGKVQQRITAQDLQKLPEATLRHVQVLEKSMENHYAVWAVVYPQLATMVDPIAKAKIEQQLKEIIKEMKGDLVGILEFLEQAGFYLDDHYIHIRNVVESV